MSKSNFLEGAWIDHQFRDATHSKPTANFIALYTSDPGEDDSGTEVTGGNYARVDHPPANANWDAQVDGMTANTTEITFPTPSASWGQITHFQIMSAATGGDVYYHGVLTDPKTVNNGDPAPKFPAGTLTVTES